MTHRFFLLMFLLLAVSPLALAQGPGDYHKVEVYAGFVHARLAPNSGEQTYVEGPDTFSFEPCTPDGLDALGPNLQRIFCKGRGFNGFDASVTRNLTKYLGIKGNVVGLFKNDTAIDDFGFPVTNKFKERTLEFLGGLQVKNNSKTARFKPFLHVLAGVARQTQDSVTTSPDPGFNFRLEDTATSFAMKVGGGVDVRLTPKIDLRLIEVNYNPIFARRRQVRGDLDLTLAGRRADNFTIGVGIAIH